MNNFEHRVLRIERLNTAVQRCASTSTEFASRFLEQFRTQGFLCIESTAVQRCPRKSTEFASGSKIVDENGGEMETSSVTQGSTHRGFC